jgi:hypothetical protein
VDTCDDDTGECESEPVIVDDGNLCTVNHSCIVVGGMPKLVWDDVICPDGGHGMVGECHPDTGNCTYRHECVECECEVCNDGNVCTRDRCDHRTGCCKHDPIDCGGMSDECTVWACEARYGGCHPVWHRDCNDHNPCTIDSCEPMTGECISVPRDCAAELNITFREGNRCEWPACNRESGECFIAGPPGLDDGNSCTEDLCDPETGPYRIPVECPSTPDSCSTSLCMDTMGGCVVIPVVCDDSNACTDDYCDPESGRCLTSKRQCGCDGTGHVSGNACLECGCSDDAGGCFVEPVDCDDGNECTDDMCDQRTGCAHEKKDCGCDGTGHSEGDWCMMCRCDSHAGGCITWEVDCDDKNPGTLDRCDGDARVCRHAWVECPDDGDKCTEEKIDVATGECLHTKIACDDSNQCTNDSCDPETGWCLHEHICPCDELGPCWICDCDPSTGECRRPIEKDCDDGNVCTRDACDHDTGKCMHQRADPPLPPGDGDGGGGDDGDSPRDKCIKMECMNDRGGWVESRIDCRDGNPCTHDHCNPRTGECLHEPRFECEPDHPCYVSECNSMTGRCVSRPVQVDDGDPCTIDACVPGTQGGDPYTVVHTPACSPNTSNACLIYIGCERSTGRCMNVPAKCDDMNECTIDDCVPSIGCTHAQRNCDDGNPCTDDRCSADAGGCINTPIKCDDHDESTIDRCVGTDENALGYECIHTIIPCDDGLWCTDDTTDRRTGECIHEPVECRTPRGEACIVGRCDEELDRCVYEAKICDVPPGSGCMMSMCVHGTGECSEPISMDCDDDDMCTVDGCDNRTGTCIHRRIICDDDDPCTRDSCDHITGGCLHVQMECHESDACIVGECIPEIGECVYSQRRNCTSPDRCFIGGCDRLTGACISAPVDCDDSDWCTIDSCSDGKCIHSQKEPCRHRPCLIEACYPGDGSCVYTRVECDDHDPRTIDRCDTETDECVHDLVPCETPEDPCVSVVVDGITGNCIRKAKDCDDENPCTNDVCRREDGECLHYVRDCADGVNCTVDSCDISTGECVNARVDCDDKNGCTTDRCEESTGRCVHDPQWNGGPEFLCDKWHNCPYRMTDKCTCSECYPGNGLWYESRVDCDDGNPCTVDSCDPISGCMNTPIECPDPPPCFTGGCNKHTGRCENRSIDCNDGIPITLDYCDPDTGKCEHALQECENNDRCIINRTNNYGICVATPKDCVDGAPCTIDSCVDGECIHTYKNCDDNITCTYDYCEWNTGKCKHQDIVCWSPDPCVISECVEGQGCVSTNKDCIDEDPCTIDSCIPMTGECDHSQINVDDGNACTMDSCVDGFPVHIQVMCDDDDACTEDRCNTTTGECVYEDIICEAPDPCTRGICVPCHERNPHPEEDRHHHDACNGSDAEYKCVFKHVEYDDDGPDHECAEYVCDRRTGRKVKRPIHDGEKCGRKCALSMCIDGECIVISDEECHHRHDHPHPPPQSPPAGDGNDHHDGDGDWIDKGDILAFSIGCVVIAIILIGSIVGCGFYIYRKRGDVPVVHEHATHHHPMIYHY